MQALRLRGARTGAYFLDRRGGRQWSRIASRAWPNGCGAGRYSTSALWTLLRDRRLDGLKFRRQVVIGPYVTDFVCPRHRLIVEADGSFHDEARDAVRDALLAAEGLAQCRKARETRVSSMSTKIAFETPSVKTAIKSLFAGDRS